MLAETKDHADWELIGQCAKSLTGEAAGVLKSAYDEVEDEEDEHLYHTQGWCRELWLKALGLPAVLPPAEEKKAVKTAIEAATARKESIASDPTEEGNLVLRSPLSGISDWNELRRSTLATPAFPPAHGGHSGRQPARR